jgi:hypothetical protein
VRTTPICTFCTKSAANHSGSNSHLYSTPDGPGRLPRIFAIVIFKIWIVAGSSSPRSAVLMAEKVIEVRVCPEDSAINRGASSLSTAGPFRSALCACSSPRDLYYTRGEVCRERNKYPNRPPDRYCRRPSRRLLRVRLSHGNPPRLSSVSLGRPASLA